jgi:hypothetical protein
MSDRDWEAGEQSSVAEDGDTLAERQGQETEDREQALEELEQVLEVRLEAIEQREQELGMTVDSDGDGAARRDREQAPQLLAALELTGEQDAELALLFADLAKDLYQSSTLDEVLSRIVEAATSVVDGCESASVTFSDSERHWTAATHGPLAGAADDLQHRLGEGPCLSAVDEPVARLGEFEGIDDQAERWPTLRDAWTTVDAVAVLSCGLFLPPTTSKHQGALNLYTTRPDAFGPDTLDLGRILAAHASVAVATAQERETSQRKEDDFRVALEGRDVIGQAKGVLMEREGIPADQAFDILRRASQRLNLKLRDIARQVVATHDVPVPESGPGKQPDGDGTSAPTLPASATSTPTS